MLSKRYFTLSSKQANLICLCFLAQPPQPPDPWEATRDCSKDCNICIQFDNTTNGMIGHEDCLYLNIYTPELPENGEKKLLLPVMVNIHGGGFVLGNGTSNAVPDNIIKKDVVLVSFNYRLGIFGFLSFNRKEAPGNIGLRDQVQALKWVQQNISKFNGEPNNITIFGSSAGGASVAYLLLSPMAKGLFHKAISQSGTCLLHWAQNKNVKELSSKIALLSGVDINDDEAMLKHLKSLPANKLITCAMMAVAAEKFHGGINFGFVPTIEQPGDWEPFLDKSCYELLSKGEFTKVPCMSGFCSREGLLMVKSGASILDKLVKEKEFVAHLPFDIDDTLTTEMNNKLKTIYLEAENKYDEIDAFAIDFFTDVDFLGGIYVATSLISKNNAPVYFYEFAYDGQLNYLKKKLAINLKGACHGDEGGYLIKSEPLPETITDTDKLVRDRFVEMWTNFAKHG